MLTEAVKPRSQSHGLAPGIARAPSRIAVIGCPGSGKSRLARRLGRITGLPVIHLDDLFWGPGWTATPSDTWRRTIEELASRPAWVLDGNYADSLDVRIHAADAVLFIDAPTIVCVRRVVLRQLARGVGRRGVSPARIDAEPELDAGWREIVPLLALVWTFRRRVRPRVLAQLARVRGRTAVFVISTVEEVDRCVNELALASWSRTPCE